MSARTVWKTTHHAGEVSAVQLPTGALFLAADVADNPELVDCWWDVDRLAPGEIREIAISGTGHPVPDDAVWLATVRHRPSMLVWHVWRSTQ